MERSIRKPHGQITALLEALFVFRPIPYPILRLRVLVLASLRILDGWRLWSVLLSIVTLMCNGPLGDALVLLSAPVLFKHAKKA